jgi:hypothetical protein
MSVNRGKKTEGTETPKTQRPKAERPKTNRPKAERPKAERPKTKRPNAGGCTLESVSKDFCIFVGATRECTLVYGIIEYISLDDEFFLMDILAFYIAYSQIHIVYANANGRKRRSKEEGTL